MPKPPPILKIVEKPIFEQAIKEESPSENQKLSKMSSFESHRLSTASPKKEEEKKEAPKIEFGFKPSASPKDSKPASGSSSINMINSKPKEQLFGKASEFKPAEVKPAATNPFMANKKPEASSSNPFLKAGGASSGFTAGATASNPFAATSGSSLNPFAAKSPNSSFSLPTPSIAPTNAFAATTSPFIVNKSNFKAVTP